MLYSVQVSRTVREWTWVEVEADTEAAARRKGVKKAREEGDFCDGGPTGHRTHACREMPDVE